MVPADVVLLNALLIKYNYSLSFNSCSIPLGYRNTPLKYSASDVPAGEYLDIDELGETLQELASSEVIHHSRDTFQQSMRACTLSKRTFGGNFQHGKCNLLVVEPGKRNYFITKL